MIEPDLPAIVRQVDSLDELAGQINGAHEAGMQSMGSGLSYFRQVGAMLSRAKDKCGHGHWLEWVSKNLKFSDRQARNYMRLHREWDQIKSELSSDLTGALKILTRGTQEVDEDCVAEAVPESTEMISEEHPFAELLSDVLKINRRITVASAGESEAEKKLRAYLSAAGLLDHLPDLIEDDERLEAKTKFIALKGVHRLIDLAGRPGRKTDAEIKRIYDIASGGWIPPMTDRRRKQKELRRVSRQ